MKKVTDFQYLLMQRKLLSLKGSANEKVKQGADVSGSDGDGHHDEGYQLSKRETWVADNLANELSRELDQCVPTKPEEQNEIVQIGNAIVFEEDKIFIVDNVVRAKGVISNALLFGKKQGDMVGKFKIEKILLPSEAEKIFWERNKEYSTI